MPHTLSRLGILALTLLLSAARPSPTLAQEEGQEPQQPQKTQTYAADRFVDAAGVNIHLHYNNTAYRDQFPLIKSRLIELGVRHVRDGLEDTTWQGYYERHNSLGEAGIKGTFITSPAQSTELWIKWPSRVRKSFEAFEAPNEYDKSNKKDWVALLTDTVKRLRSLRDVPGLEDFPVYGPSLTTASAFHALGDVSAYFDYANMHNYYSGRHPCTTGWGANGYGSITWNLGISGQYAREKPTVTTETGYQDVQSAVDPVPQEVAGRYMPRLLLEHFRRGIVRTFLYELVDFPRSGGYGMLNQDGSPKPAFTAVKELLNLLSDPGPAFTPRDLPYTLLGENTNRIRHMVFQKRNGSYYMALWLAIPSWDPRVREAVQPEGQRVTVSFQSPMRILRTHRWQANGSTSVEATATTTSSLQMNVSDSLTIVEAVRPGTGRFMAKRTPAPTTTRGGKVVPVASRP